MGYPNLDKVVNHISTKSLFQKKAVKNILDNADSKYLAFAEEIIIRLNTAIGRGESHDYIATAYLDYTKMIRLEEMYFMKEGKYRLDNFNDAYEEIYSQDGHMHDYVVGLGLTQIFWPNHYEIVRFYLDTFLPRVKDSGIGAEVGVGHGIFHCELLRSAQKIRTTLIDISPVSLDMTKKMIAATNIDENRTSVKISDIQKEIPLKDQSLDVLLLGELIEHLQEGELVLSALAKKMKKSGYCFFTTATNAPAEDHILLFRSLNEIRGFINRCGWQINDEHVGTIKRMSLEDAEKGGHTINYASIISIK